MDYQRTRDFILLAHQETSLPIVTIDESIEDAIDRILQQRKDKKNLEPTILSSSVELDQLFVLNCMYLSSPSYSISLPVQTSTPKPKSIHQIPTALNAFSNELKPSIPQKRSPEDSFVSAKEIHNIETIRTSKKSLGLTRSGSKTKPGFVSPLLAKKQEDSKFDSEGQDKLGHLDPQMVQMIKNEIMNNLQKVSWEDVAGLNHAKKSIQEIVVWPMLRPDIFHGLRGPPKGLLLFGPPGTGKTMIGKCIASQCNATFFSISSSVLTSKWVGEGEKMVKTLFGVARAYQPAVIFVDEIDSLLSQRTDGEFEASRRIKTEFLVQFDGCGTSTEDRILLIGATNRPHEIDEAARRRFQKRLYIPLPEPIGRETIIKRMLSQQKNSISESEMREIVEKTDGYSGSDMDGLVREAALGPIRDIQDITKVGVNDVREISYCDFVAALSQVRASVSQKDLGLYQKFEHEFGSFNL